MSVRDALPVPEEAKRSPEAQELVRVWLAGNRTHVSLRIGAWDDATGCGALLADLAAQIADAYSAQGAADRRAVLERIKEAMLKELDSPTDEPTGQIIDDEFPGLGTH